MQEVYKPGSKEPFGMADAAQIAKAGDRFAVKPTRGKTAPKAEGSGDGNKANDGGGAGDGGKGGADPSAVKKS